MKNLITVPIIFLLTLAAIACGTDNRGVASNDVTILPPTIPPTPYINRYPPTPTIRTLPGYTLEDYGPYAEVYPGVVHSHIPFSLKEECQTERPSILGCSESYSHSKDRSILEKFQPLGDFYKLSVFDCPNSWGLEYITDGRYPHGSRVKVGSKELCPPDNRIQATPTTASGIPTPTLPPHLISATATAAAKRAARTSTPTPINPKPTPIIILDWNDFATPQPEHVYDVYKQWTPTPTN